MTASERIASIAKQLDNGESVQPVTVREFLSWFGAQRRGYWIVAEIHNELEKHKLKTEPDFESEYIDSPISLTLIPAKKKGKLASEIKAVELAGSGQATSEGVATLTVATPYADPTYRISKLAAANNAPLTVAPDASLSEAATKMLTHGYSQLPVMNGREVKGVVSWTSIGTRLALGGKSSRVRELMDQAQEIRADASMFQAIPIIVQHQYVLVRAADNRISGIVTSSDLSLQFQLLAEPFLMLSEIENHIRRLIGSKFSQAELVQARDPGATDRRVNRVEDLAFGEYLRLLENPERWTKLGLAIDRATFCKQLDRVREIRNEVMHFDPDGASPTDRETLREFAQFLQKLHSIGVS